MLPTIELPINVHIPSTLVDAMVPQVARLMKKDDADQLFFEVPLAASGKLLFRKSGLVRATYGTSPRHLNHVIDFRMDPRVWRHFIVPLPAAEKHLFDRKLHETRLPSLPRKPSASRFKHPAHHDSANPRERSPSPSRHSASQPGPGLSGYQDRETAGESNAWTSDGRLTGWHAVSALLCSTLEAN